MSCKIMSLKQVTRLESQLSTLRETSENQTKIAGDLNNKLKQVIKTHQFCLQQEISSNFNRYIF